MSIPVDQELLRNEIDDQIKSYRSRRDNFRGSSSHFFIAAAVATGLTTIFVGMGGLYDNLETVFAALALITSAVASFLTIVEGKFDNRAMWVHYAEALNELYALSFDMDNLDRSNLTDKQSELQMLKKRLETILTSANSKWINRRSEQR